VFVYDYAAGADESDIIVLLHSFNLFSVVAAANKHSAGSKKKKATAKKQYGIYKNLK
jgi:hypothetical protein